MHYLITKLFPAKWVKPIMHMRLQAYDSAAPSHKMSILTRSLSGKKGCFQYEISIIIVCQLGKIFPGKHLYKLQQYIIWLYTMSAFWTKLCFLSPWRSVHTDHTFSTYVHYFCIFLSTEFFKAFTYCSLSWFFSTIISMFVPHCYKCIVFNNPFLPRPVKKNKINKIKNLFTFICFSPFAITIWQLMCKYWAPHFQYTLVFQLLYSLYTPKINYDISQKFYVKWNLAFNHFLDFIINFAWHITWKCFWNGSWLYLSLSKTHWPE